MDVPIYKLQTLSYSFKSTISNNDDAYFAEGSLIGKFYTLEGQVNIEKIRFIGNFKGSVEYSEHKTGCIYF